MKKILIFFVLFLFPFLVNAEGNVVVSSVENIYEEESGISIDESESRNIIFNDIGQSFKYKVVLENISDETLVVENIKLSEPVVDFMKYGVFDIEVGEELEAGAKKELYVTVDSLSDKGYGYNFADTLNLEVVFNEKAPSTDEYLKWYASMYPNNAAKIYQELLEKQSVEASLKDYADILTGMDAGKAAAILSEMPSDIDLICELLGCMKKGDQSAILEEMEDLFAARIVNRMTELGMAGQ